MGHGMLADPPGEPVERDVDAHRIEALIPPFADRIPVAAADIEQTLTGLILIAEKSGQKHDPFRSSSSFEDFSFGEQVPDLRFGISRGCHALMLAKRYAWMRWKISPRPSEILGEPCDLSRRSPKGEAGSEAPRGFLRDADAEAVAVRVP